ncbi:hypothetical protein MMC07_004411 [Pseudocyphellaria aurata]|nr:hypothetical protein [Pseudocyphellaria aurata]
MSYSSSRKSREWDGLLAPWRHHGLTDTPLNIQGLSRDQFSPSDMYKPFIRVYPAPCGREKKDANVMDYLRSAPFLEYIDVTTTWKGISLPDVEVLFQIHQVFKTSLESVLVEDLRSLHQQFCQEFSRNLTEDIYRSSLTRQINFSRDRLVQKMIWTLRPRENWDVYLRLLPLYLSTCDCLKTVEGEESQATAIELRMCYNELSWYLNPPGPVAESAWIPDRLDFGPIQTFQCEGQELVIIPYYYTNSFSEENDNNVQISYSITSSQSWLSWNDSIGGFRGTLPMYSELQRRDDQPYKVYPASPECPYNIINILRIDLRGLVTKGRLPGPHLERILRARLTFKIHPWYAHISTRAPSDDYVRPFAQFSAYDSPKISWASSESLPIESNISDNVFIHSRTLHKRGAQPIELERSPPIPVRSMQKSRRRRLVSGQEINSPKTRHRETTNLFSMTKPQSPSDGGSSTIDHVLAKSICCLSMDRKQTLHSPRLFNLNRFSFLRELGPRDDSGKLASLSRSSNLLNSENENLEIPDQIRKYISDPELPFSEEAVIDREPMADYTAYDAPVFMKESMLAFSLSQISHSIEATARKRASPRKRPYYSSSSDSSSGNSEPSSRESIHDLSGPTKHGSPRNSPSTDSPRRCSSSIDVILEDSSVAPGLRREQALLWKALSANARGSPVGDSVLNLQEQKDIYEAMKKSAEEEQNKRDEKLGLADVLDDLFVNDSSDGIFSEDALVESNSEQSGPLSEDDSGLGSVDQGLEDSVNYGF